MNSKSPTWRGIWTPQTGELSKIKIVAEVVGDNKKELLIPF